MASTPKKRGRKPGVKVGPYKSNQKYLSDAALNKLFGELEKALVSRIRYMQNMMKRI